MNQDLHQHIPTDSNILTGTLSNGFTYYILRNATPKDKVELRLVVRTGSVLEEQSQRGLAHFIEHMAFKGTEHFPGTEIINHLSSLGVGFGADLNASTGFDRTMYMIPIASKYIDTGLKILNDWAFGLSLNEKDIDTERGVILEELRVGQGADQRMRDRWFPKLMEGTPYACRMPIGLKEVIENATREEFVRFYKRWYRPEFMAVIAVGDMDPEDTLSKIKKIFDRPVELISDDNVKPEAECRDSIPTHLEVIVETDPEAQYNITQLIFKRPFAYIGTKKQYEDFILRNIYISMVNARLVDLSQGEKPDFLYGSSSYYHLVNTVDVFIVYAILPPERIEGSIKRLLEEVEKFKRYGFGQKEYLRAKDIYLNRLLRRVSENDKTSSSVFAEEYVGHFIEGDAIPGVQYEYKFTKEFLANVDIEKINASSKLLFSTDKYILLTGSSAKMPTEQQLHSINKEILDKDIKQWQEDILPEHLIEDMPKAVPLEKRTDHTDIGLTELLFKGGVRVLLKPSTNKNDEILFSAYRCGGRSLYEDELHISSLLSTRVAEESGVGVFTKSNLKKHLAGKTVGLGMSVNTYQDGISGYSSVKDVKTLFELIYLTFTSPRFNELVFNSQREKSIAILKASHEDPSEYFSDFVKQTLSQGHHRGEQRPEVEHLSMADFESSRKAWYKSFSHPDQFTYIFVGSFTVEQMIPLVEQYIAPFGSDTPASSCADLGIRPPKGKYEQIIYRGVDEKAIVSLIFDTPAKYSIELAMAFLGLSEVLKIILIERLRSKMSAVYGVRVEVDFMRIPYTHTRLHINIPCAPDTYKMLIDATIEELNLIIKNGPDHKTVENVRATRIRQLEDSFHRNGFWMMNIQRFSFLGDDIGRVGRMLEEVEYITVENVQRAARELVNTQEFITLVMLPQQDK